MAPINESREEESGEDRASQRQREVHQLDTLWADFRLPVPLAAPGKARPPGGGDDARDERAAWRLRAVDLLRLLHAMNENPPDREERGAVGERSAESQATLARALLAAAERTFPWNSHGVDDRLLQKLRQETKETCAKFHHWLERHQRERATERDLIYDIFLAPPAAAMDPTATTAAANEEELLLDDFEDENPEEEGGGNTVSFEEDAASPTANATQRQPARHPAPPTAAAVDPVAFQKEQQELLEAELASMATLLKSSTLAMNATLQTQTQDLDHMEELAQTNLDEVTRTTKRVEERLAKKKGWKKRLATWSLIGTVLGMWVVCFLVIRTVPKRQRVRIVYGKKDGGGPSLGEQVMAGGRRAWQRLFPQPLWEEDGEDDEEEGERRRREAAQRDNARREAGRRHRENVQQERAHRQEERRRRQGQGGEEERRRPDQRRPEEEECEVLADGTQACGPLTEQGRTEAKVRALAAERRRQRIAANMATARAVEAVDSAAEPEEPEEEDYDYRERGGDEDEDGAGEEVCREGGADGCLARDERGEEDGAARDARHEAARENAAEEERRRRHAEQERRDDFHREGARRAEEEQRRLEEARREAAVAEQEEGEARARREAQRTERTRAAAEAARQAELERLEEERHYQERNTAEQREREEEEEARRMAEEQEAKQEAAQLEHERLAAVAARKAERERLEEERLYQERMMTEKRKNEKEKARRLADEQARMEAERVDQARVEAQRQEQARLGAEVARKAEQERLERERIEQERIMAERRKKEEEEARRLAEERASLEAERVELERLAAAAVKKEELERLERERVEQERVMAEQRKKEEEEARRLAEERARLEAERVERERLAAEAAEKEEQARQLADAKAEAERAMELSKDIAADNDDFLPSDVRLAAGRRRNDLLAHYITASPETVDAADRSGWSPLHEAARAGNLGGVQLLLSAGCDLTARTGRAGKGGTALWWAVQRYGEDHGVVRLLRAHDALEEGPA